MIQLNDPQLEGELTSYLEDPKYTDPPQPLTLLFQTQGPLLPQIHYLYSYFSKSHIVANNRKKLMIAEVFRKVIMSRMGELLDELLNVNSDLAHSSITKVINAPVILLNLNPDQNLVVSTYAFLVANLGKVQPSARYSIINRLVILGHESLILQDPSPVTRDTILHNFIQITKNYKILIFLIHHDQQHFTTLFETLPPHQRLQMINHLVYSNQLKPSDALFISTLKTEIVFLELISTLMCHWCEPSFFQETPYTQKLVSNLLCLYLKEVDREYLDSIVVYINSGITNRFQFSQSYDFVRQSGLLVWKTYFKAMKMESEEMSKSVEDLCSFELFEDDRPVQNIRSIMVTNEQVIKRVEIPIVTQKNSPSNQSQDQEASTSNPFQPKNLYDCYLGLTSNNLSRKRICLKSITGFVRGCKDDLIFTWDKILSNLLFLHDEEGSMRDFEQQRVSAVTSLMIYQPIEVIGVLSQRFFNKECCLADKVMILNSISQSVTQLSNDPQRYHLEEKEEEFYFKKVSSKYTKTVEKEKIEQEKEKSEKVEGQSRRWGHTKNQHQRLQTKEPSSLVSIKRADLVVSEKNPYVNRLYQIAEQVFFTFAYRIPTLKSLFTDITFMCCLFTMFNTFVDSLRNYHKKYLIIGEILEILLQVTHQNPQLQKSRLGVVIKVASILDNNLSNHQLIIGSLQTILKELRVFQLKSFDPTIKIMLEVIEERFYSLIQNIYTPPSPSVSLLF